MLLLDDKQDPQLEKTLAADASVVPPKAKTVTAEDQAQAIECKYLIASE